MTPPLPPEAIELGRRIIASAPPVSDAKLARLRLLLHGTVPAAAESHPAAPASPAAA